MKHLLRVPTSEQYAYIEFEFEGDRFDAVDEYKRLTEYVRNGPGSGLPEREYNKFLEDQIAQTGIPNGAELYGKMSLFQQATVQDIKRCLARIKNKSK